MKQLITLLLISFSGMTQNLDTSAVMISTDTINYYMTKIGSCASPDGSMNSIPSPPSSHAYLQSNGYCNPGIATTSTVTMCYTFTPTTSSVILDGGFSEACQNNNFSAFSVYNSSCVFITSSQTPTGLTPGQQYTWCVTMRAWNGVLGGIFYPSCNGYITFCPYFIPVSTLPTELSVFNGECGEIWWESISEYNSDRYELRVSDDGYLWRVVKTIQSNNSISGSKYKTDITEEGYYKLLHYDFDGSASSSKIIKINCSKEVDHKVYDVTGRFLGNSIPQNGGIYIIKDSNGNIKKY